MGISRVPGRGDLEIPAALGGGVTTARVGAKNLPRTPGNLDELRAAEPPEGFQQVDQLSGEHVESCN